MTAFSAIAQAGELRFHAPAGWTDLSPNAPAANFAAFPPEVAAQLRAQPFPFHCGDLQHSDPYMPNVSAIVRPRTGELDVQRALDEVTRDLPAEVARQSPGAKYRVVARDVIALHGVAVGRFTADFDVGPLRLEQLGYLLPGEHELATMTFTTTRDSFARDRATFEAAAAATDGLFQEPAPSSHPPIALFAAIGALAIGALAFRMRKKMRA